MSYLDSLMDLNGKVASSRSCVGIGESRLEANVVKLTAVVNRMKAGHRRFMNGSHAGVITGSEGALILPSHEQHVQMSPRDLSASILETRRVPVLTPPNRQRHRPTACFPLGASTREPATENGKPPQI
jgi:hypothetical protein